MRVPSRASPCRALHVPLGRRGSSTGDQRPDLFHDSGGIDLRHRLRSGRRRKGGWPFVHRQDVGAQAEPCRDTPDEGARQSIRRRGNGAGAQPLRRTAPGRHPKRTCQFLGRQRVQDVRGRARPSVPHDVEHNRPGRVRTTQSHQQSRQSLAFGHLPAGTLVQHQQSEAVEQRQPRGVMAVVAPDGRLQHRGLHGHVAPQPRLTCEATPRRAPSAAGDGVHIPDARPSGSAVVERCQHMRLERSVYQPHPQPGTRLAWGIGSLVHGRCRHQPATSPPRLERLQPADNAVGAQERREAGCLSAQQIVGGFRRPQRVGLEPLVRAHEAEVYAARERGMPEPPESRNHLRPHRARHVVEHSALDPHAPAACQIERRAVVERDKACGQQRRDVRWHVTAPRVQEAGRRPGKRAPLRRAQRAHRLIDNEIGARFRIRITRPSGSTQGGSGRNFV